MFKPNSVLAGLGHATEAITSRALLKATLVLALLSALSIALLASAAGIALGANPPQAGERAFASPLEEALGVRPLSEPAPPEVFTIEPSVGPTTGGTSVKIKGTGFVKGSTVTIGAAATSVEVKSETEISAKTAAGSAGEDEVIVAHEGHESSGGPSFTYVQLPAVTSVTPTEGSTAGGTEVVIKGSGFIAGSSVTIGVKVTSLTIVSENELKAKTAPEATAGKYEVIVVDKRGASSGGPSFTYVAPPAVSSIAPAEGSTEGGTSVTVKGTSFSKAVTMTVKIGGAEATGVSVVSATELTAKTPAGSVGKAAVVVSDEFGTSGSATQFAYFAPPTVTKVEPSAGPTTGGTSVKVKGTGFVKGATVTIGAAATSVEVKTETEILAKTAAGSAGEDEVKVTDVGGTGKSASGEGFTYVTPPTVTSVAPAEGSTAGGTEVVIKGTGFAEHSTVAIGAAATGVEFKSATEIVAKTAAGTAGKDKVVVSLADGVASTGTTEFTYVAPPAVSSIAPAEGSTEGGTSVTVKGTSFSKAVTMTVKIGGAEATGVSVVSATELTAKTPAGSVGKAAVVVSDEFGTSGSATQFAYFAPPTVTKVEPSAGPTTGGTSVKVKGTGFVKGATVTIGAAATSVEVKTETEILAKTAAGSAGEDEVKVTDVGGTGKSASGEGFTYVTPPTVTSVAPAEGSTAGGTEVVIKGTGFAEHSTVAIGAAATGVEFKSATEIVAKTAAGTAGKDKVVVSLADGVASTGTTEFTYVAPPAVSSIAPAEGSTEGGTSVTVKGTSFSKAVTMTVKIGGAEATGVSVVSATELTAKTPAGSVGKAAVVVSDEFGTSGSATQFAYFAPPTVTKVEPSAGPTTGGTSVKVKGTGFVKGATVTIGAAATSVEVKTETEILAKTAAGSAGEDEVKVTDVGGTGKSASGEGFTYVTPPTVTSVAPAEGSTAGGTEVVIKGTGFAEHSTVAIGAAATGVEFKSATEIVAKTAAGTAGKDKVVVSLADGVASTGTTEFTYVAPPAVSSIAPAEGSTEGGTSVTVKGTSFSKAVTMTVKIGGAEATGVSVVSATELTAKTPAGSVGKAAVVVSDEFGTSGSATQFAYFAPPTVTKVEPSAGPTTGGTSVKVKGTGFVKGATVTIGAAATSVEVKTETEILAKTAAGSAGEDEVKVTDVGGTGKSASGEGFTYVTPPTVTSVAPAEGSTAGGTEVVIKGTGFAEHSTVAIGAAATGVEFKSATEIVAKTAAGTAGKDKVVVSLADGVASTGTTEFTYVAPPAVSSIAPAEGSTEGGTSVTVKGTSFSKAVTMTVKIGGAEATGVSVVSATELTAKTPAGSVGKAAVVVSDEFGTSGSATQFAYFAPPTVTKVEPSAGPTTGGTSVKVKGTGFVKGATVTIGAAATSVEVKTETEILAKTAAGSAGEDEVKVTDVGGTGKSASGEGFTYVTPPTVTSVAPAEGSTAGGTEVVIKGTGFAEHSTVAIGAAATGVEFKSATEIVAKTAAGTAGKDKVVVSLADGVASTGTTEFTYVAPPAVSSIAPAEGSTEGGTSVTVKGTSFSKAVTMTVKIGGAEATGVSVVSATELTAKTPAGSVGKAAVVVSDEFGTSGSATQFAYFAPPTVTKVEPSAGPTTGGTSVKVKGTGFVKGATVTIGAAATSVEVKTETEILAKTAAGSAGEDEVKVTDVGGTGKSASGEGFTYVTPPTVTSVAPAEGSTAGGTEVVIKGTGFAEHSTVAIGAAATGVEFKSATEIVAKTAAGTAGKDKVVVSLADGVASTGTTEFTYVAPPAVSSIAPAEGSTEGETVVKIKGTGFMKGSTVKIGVSVAAFIVVSSTEIVAETAAEAAGKYPVLVADKFGTSGSATQFTYVTPVSPEFVREDVGGDSADVVGPAPGASPPASSPSVVSRPSTREAIRLTATVSGGLVHLHLAPAGRRTGRMLVTLRLVHGSQLLAVITHAVTIADAPSLTFTLKLPAAARSAATDLRVSAAYAGAPSVASPTVTVPLSRTSGKPR